MPYPLLDKPEVAPAIQTFLPPEIFAAHFGWELIALAIPPRLL